MCGYIGFVDNIDNKRTVAEAMLQKIAHRGPDSQDFYTDDNVALGFCRLSIIDLQGGNQPMFNEDASKILTFNGEIYNYKELKKDLLEKGHKFATDSDSEVIIHGYEEYGAEIAEKLRGMFSFVIWDKNTKKLFGARDPFGIKPFYYTLMNNSLIFGSEIKAFFEHPNCKKEFNERVLEAYMSFQYNPDDETFFKGIYKLAPGHFIESDGTEVKITKYHFLKFKPEKNLDMEKSTNLIDEAMKNSVKAHKISDVEVGSFLSGGVDSSFITGLANVDKTFSVGFDGPKYSELQYAKELSTHIGVNNYSTVITGEKYWGVFPDVQYHMDEPLADPSCVALYCVCELASKQVKTVLSGEGSDELFGGYRIYCEPSAVGWYNHVPGGIRRTLARLAMKMPEIPGKAFLIRRGLSLEERYIGNAYIFSETERFKYLKNSTHTPLTSYTKKFYDEVRDMDAPTKMQYLDINTWLVGDILLKADKMSMAHSLEARVPFLDKVIEQTAVRIPVSSKLHKGSTKTALRNAAKRHIPVESATRDKLGFPVPIRVWLKEDKYYEKVKTEFKSETAEKYFNTNALISLLDDHKEGKTDNSRKIWVVYTFLTWYKQYFK